MLLTGLTGNFFPLPPLKLIAGTAIFLIALLVAFPASAAGKTKKKPKPYDYESSKYKAYRALTDDEPKSYRFDMKGNPIPPVSSKKKPPRKKKAAPQLKEPATLVPPGVSDPAKPEDPS
jgi:hypothetical protein